MRNAPVVESSKPESKRRELQNRSAIGSLPIFMVWIWGASNDTQGLVRKLQSTSTPQRWLEAPHRQPARRQYDGRASRHSRRRTSPGRQKPMELLARSSALVASGNLSVDQSHLASQFLGRKPRHTNPFAAPGLAGGNGNQTVRQLQKFREEFDAGLVGMAFHGWRG